MKGEGEHQVIEMVRPKSSLLESLKAPVPDSDPAPDAAAASPAGEKLIPLPLPGDPYETAYARPDHNPPTIRFLTGESIRGFPYPNLDTIDWVPAEKPGESPSILIWFSGLVPMQVILAGRNLLLLYDLISNSRIAWVRELPKGKDLMGSEATVITRIAVSRIKKPRDESEA